MSRQRSRSVKYYCCPVCGKNSTDRIAIEKHYRERHPVKIDEVIYCNICGAGWHVNAYGDRGARERAAACYQSHIDNGDMDETAGMAFFLSGGSFGYVNVKKGGLQDGKKEKEPGKRE